MLSALALPATCLLFHLSPDAEVSLLQLLCRCRKSLGGLGIFINVFFPVLCVYLNEMWDLFVLRDSLVCCLVCVYFEVF